MGKNGNGDPGNEDSDRELDDFARDLGADDADDLRRKLNDEE